MRKLEIEELSNELNLVF